jgi:filamentous hemagglutinin
MIDGWTDRFTAKPDNRSEAVGFVVMDIAALFGGELLLAGKFSRVSKVDDFGMGANATGQTGARSVSLKEIERQETAALRMYDDIRASTTDIQNIAANTGLKNFQVARVKNHLFYDDTHKLRASVGRFDPDYEIGQAWQRMETGQHLPQDIQLFKHEYFESRFEKIFRTDYGTAHNKTQLRYPSPLD